MLPAHQQDELTALANALDPVRLFEQLQQLQQAVFRCAVGPSLFVPCSPDPSVLRFALEDCTAGPIQMSRTVLDPAEVLHTLRREQRHRRSLLDWKRTSKNPFAGEWEQILAWVQANPERTSADIFRELQRRTPGRYRPSQIRTLQRGLHQIRTQLLDTREEPEPTEAIQGERPADPAVSTPQGEAINQPFPSLPVVSFSQEPIEARPVPGSLPPAEEAICPPEPATGPGTKRPPHSAGKRRRQPPPVPLPSVSADASPSPLTVDRAIQLYLQDRVANERSSKTIEWHRTALGLLQRYLLQEHPLLLISHLTERDIRGWLVFLRAEPSATGTRRATRVLST